MAIPGDEIMPPKPVPRSMQTLRLRVMRRPARPGGMIPQQRKGGGGAGRAYVDLALLRASLFIDHLSCGGGGGG